MVTACLQSIDMKSLMPNLRGGLRDRGLNIAPTKKNRGGKGFLGLYHPVPQICVVSDTTIDLG